jgi:hypothetical protein
MYAPSPARGPATRRRTTQGAWRCTHHLRRTSNKTAHDAGSVAMYAPSPADHPQDGARRRERGDVRTISGARTSNKTAHDAGSVAMYAPSPARGPTIHKTAHDAGSVAMYACRGKRDVGGAAVVVGKGESFTHFYLSCIPIRRSESL